MNKALWAAQILLGFAFLMAGGMKLVTPYETLAGDMAWVTHVPAAVVKLIAFLEVLGALGLILPSVLRIKPWLTPLAAAGLVLTMVGAIATHIAIGEAHMTAPPIVVGALAAFIAWGRHKRDPIVAK
jgi:putative oxidoreductase